MIELSIIGLTLVLMGLSDHIEGAITRKYDRGTSAFLLITVGWIVLVISL